MNFWFGVVLSINSRNSRFRSQKFQFSFETGLHLNAVWQIHAVLLYLTLKLSCDIHQYITTPGIGFRVALGQTIPFLMEVGTTIYTVGVHKTLFTVLSSRF